MSKKKGKGRNKIRKKKILKNLGNGDFSPTSTSPSSRSHSRSRSRSRHRIASITKSPEIENLQPNNNPNLSSHLPPTSSPPKSPQNTLLSSLYHESFPHNSLYRSHSTSNLLNVTDKPAPLDAPGLIPTAKQSGTPPTNAISTNTAQYNKRPRDSDSDLSPFEKPALSDTSVPVLYSSCVEGPFTVFIETSDITKRPGNLHPTTVGRIIAPLVQGNILSFSSSGALKVTVTLDVRTSANKLLNNPCFIEANIKASIPTHKLNRQAIIRDDPLDFSEEEILNYLQSSIPILGVRRLNRKLLSKDAANNAELLPTRTILLIFNGQSLPNDVFLFLVRYNLEVYVPPTKMCFKCFRYGRIFSHYTVARQLSA